jgi:hypothetical protein
VAALTAFTPLTTGVVNAGAAVAASDTIDPRPSAAGVFLRDHQRQRIAGHGGHQGLRFHRRRATS